MRKEEVRAKVSEAWRSRASLSLLIGEEIDGVSSVYSSCWGSIPTNKAEVDVEDGKISRVRTYSGLNWSAKGGYGSPIIDTASKAD